MSDESKTTEQTQSGSTPPRGDIFAELNQMGQKLGAAIQTAWENPKRKDLTDEVQEGLQEFGKQVEAAIKTARESKLGEDVRETAEKVIEEVRQSKVVDEIRDGLLMGLKQVNTQLDKLMTRMSAKTDSSPAAAETTEAAAEPEVVATPPTWLHEALDAEAAGAPAAESKE